ncbi:MAG: hypothetical protein MGG11_22115 [Trichodesmium sp. MAG_R03]|nr:hypothetical protein [Trichodesmium sp. MAG_R03]
MGQVSYSEDSAKYKNKRIFWVYCAIAYLTKAEYFIPIESWQTRKSDSICREQMPESPD